MTDHFISEAKVSGRGQIAIPKAVKERLKIIEGDYVVFIESGEDIVIRAGKLVWKGEDSSNR
ncbi:MAG: AbrB/MazE/SpoVT family DNA-binding domain-containing protein [Candidatus Methanomethylophilaceae archaeon]|nr:AbrB/MazE/SpoVT family DNA-binding domain-containing protein [Candidatus Methanomethylophilaceae archaeon]